MAAALLKNAAIAAEGVLPLCQDTGTAAIIARKGEAVRTGGDDAHALAAGVAAAYAGGRLRFSQLAPLSMCDERNTGTNLPAQIEIHAAPGDQFHFLFIAKGGGSSNKTVFFQKTKACLSDEALAAFLRRELRALGVAACPPYHLALVVGGPSPEMNLKVLKLATAGALDCLPAAPDGSGDALSRPDVGRAAFADCCGQRAGGPVRRPLAGHRGPGDPLPRGTAAVARCRWASPAAPIATPWAASDPTAFSWSSSTATPAGFYRRPWRCWGRRPAARRGSIWTSRRAKSAANWPAVRQGRWCCSPARSSSPAIWPMPVFMNCSRPAGRCPIISAGT